MALKFTKSTDSEHKVTLDSELISVTWTCGLAIGGQSAAFTVQTEMVGEGAPIKVKGKSEKGKNLGRLSGVVRRNSFSGAFDIPEDIELGDKVFFEVKLSKNSLEGESEHIPAYPPIRVSNLKWSAQEARRGDTLTLSADVKGLPNEAELAIVIYEHDQDGVHDRITELPTRVDNEKIELSWEYEYHEDTDEIATQEELDSYGSSYNPPEYFFTLKIEDTEFGVDQESGLLVFKDWIEISLVGKDGTPIGEADYVLTLPDGQTRDGTLDGAGHAREENVPPGEVRIEFPNLESILPEDESGNAQPTEEEIDNDGTAETATPAEVAEVNVTIQSGVVISDSAVTKLKDVLRASNLTSATITSGRRDSAAQARIMYNNLEASGVETQRNLYGSYGDRVIDVYEEKKNAGVGAAAIKEAMKDKIVEIGSSNVSRHCSDTHDVFDIAPSTISDGPEFEKALADSVSNGDISSYLVPPNDPAYHIVIELVE